MRKTWQSADYIRDEKFMNIAAFVISLIAGLHGLIVCSNLLTIVNFGRGVASLGRLLRDSSMIGQTNQLYVAVWLAILGAVLAIVGGGVALVKKRISSILIVAGAAFNFFSLLMAWQVGGNKLVGYTLIWGIAYTVAASVAYFSIKKRHSQVNIFKLSSGSHANPNPENILMNQGKAQESVQKVEQTYQPVIGMDTDMLIKRAFNFLKDANFGEADRYFEQTLNQDPENSRAYLGKLMVEKRAQTTDDLVNLSVPFDDNKFFKRSLRFADEEEKTHLESYARENRARLGQQYVGEPISAKVDFLVSRANVSAAAGKIEEVKRYLEEAIKIAPESSRVYLSNLMEKFVSNVQEDKN